MNIKYIAFVLFNQIVIYFIASLFKNNTSVPENYRKRFIFIFVGLCNLINLLIVDGYRHNFVAPQFTSTFVDIL